MSPVNRNRLRFTGFVGAAFAAGLLLAGFLDLPRFGHAQQVAQLGQSAAAVAAPPPADASAAARQLYDLSEAFASIAEHVKPSVVYIRAERKPEADDVNGGVPRMQLPPGFERFFQFGPGFQNPQPRLEQASGSGFIVSRDGYILTNAHVVDGAKDVTVRLLDRREYRAKVVGTDPTTDVAVLKINANDLTPAPLGNSDATRVGEWVLAVGNPLGDNLTFTVTQGIISAKGRVLNLPNRTNRSIQDFIQTDAAINPGNSGGPLVSVQGQVVGVNSAIASETGYYSGYGFAIPINLARRVMDQIIKNGHVERAALGILVRDATANDAQYVGLPEVRGVLIQDFSPEGKAAEKAGLEPGDIIVAVDGRPVEYVAQLQQTIAFRKPGEMVKVEVARKGGVRKTYTIPLQRVPERSEVASSGESGGDNAGGDEATPMAALGVSVAPLDRATIDQYSIPNGVSGVVVTDVRPDGPASESVAGPDNGGPDIILSVEGKPVRSPRELRSALAGSKPGDIVTLRLYNAQSKAYRIERVKLGSAVEK
jgi:serine protease Do